MLEILINKFKISASPKFLGKEFVSLDSKKKRGVVIYAKKDVNPTLKFKDGEGRLVAIEISTTGGKVLLVNIYAPNGAKEKFLWQLKTKLGDLVYDKLIIIGDFNGVLDFKLDKSIPTGTMKKRKCNTFKTFTKFMDQENLLDVWRIKNPQAKEYTYYSPLHNSFSRIDMMWASQAIMVKTKKNWDITKG